MGIHNQLSYAAARELTGLTLKKMENWLGNLKAWLSGRKIEYHAKVF